MRASAIALRLSLLIAVLCLDAQAGPTVQTTVTYVEFPKIVGRSVTPAGEVSTLHIFRPDED